MAGAQAVLAALVDGHDVVLRCVGHAEAAVDGDHPGIDVHLGCMGHEIHERARWRGQQPVAGTDLLLAGHQVQRGRHVVGYVATLAIGAFLEALAAHQIGLAQVLRFIAQDVARCRVLQGHGVAEHAVLARFAGFGAQGIGGVAARVDAVPGAHDHAVLHGADHARSLLQRLRIDHQGLGQEGLDEVHPERGQCRRGHAVGARAGRDAHGLGLAAGGGRAGAQAGAAIFLLQVQGLAWEDQVRVGDGGQVHAPQLGPAPGTLEEHARDAPERVSAFDHVDVGRVRGEFRQGHALLGHLLGRGALRLRDRPGLRHGHRAGEQGTGNAERAQDGARHCCNGSHVVLDVHVQTPLTGAKGVRQSSLPAEIRHQSSEILCSSP